MIAKKKFKILMAEDDRDDYILTKTALSEITSQYELTQVKDGQELLDYLLCQGDFKKPAPFPDLILLDLNMPKKDGKQALREIKSRPEIRHLPVVIYTTSNAGEDINYCYRAGTNSYIQKPNTFAELVEVMKTLFKYWFDVNLLPENGVKERC